MFAPILLASMFASPAAHAGGVRSVLVSETQIVVKFDDVVEKAQSFVLDGPGRIALDIGGAERGKVAQPGGYVSAVRQAQFNPKTARIVFDLVSPAVVSGGSFSGDGRTLTLALKPVEDDAFTSAAKQGRKTFMPPLAFSAKPPRSKYSLTVPLGAPSNALPRPKIYGPAGRPLVVIDAGHGGHDPGAISPVNGRHEKDATLGIARRIKDELLASGRVRVALTREDDRFLVLRERSAIAKNIKADLFISIHADSAGEGASGATIYTLSEVASDAEAAKLARRENKADIINGVNLGGENADVANILLDLAQRETMNDSSRFADLLKREGSQALRLRSDYHKTAGFAVLKQPDMPAILLETGYLTNASDVERLYSDEGQRSIAAGVRRAVEIHFARRLAMK
jgi:N-acetylmuramoyl-L-alanine amidase